METGQIFEDDFGYVYVYDKETDTVTTEGYEPYQLNYDPDTESYWIEGSDGYTSYYLTPMKETSDADSQSTAGSANPLIGP